MRVAVVALLALASGLAGCTAVPDTAGWPCAEERRFVSQNLGPEDARPAGSTWTWHVQVDDACQASMPNGQFELLARPVAREECHPAELGVSGMVDRPDRATGWPSSSGMVFPREDGTVYYTGNVDGMWIPTAGYGKEPMSLVFEVQAYHRLDTDPENTCVGEVLELVSLSLDYFPAKSAVAQGA